jgi:hypothetical protein
MVALGLSLMGYLNFEGLIHNLWHSGIILRFFMVKSVTLAFEGLGAEGVRLDLMTIATLGVGLATSRPGHWSGP